jgi:type II secretory ATPase GspE/PulE/Tfp pilus assembly ATPase PilB-like protein
MATLDRPPSAPSFSKDGFLSGLEELTPPAAVGHLIDHAVEVGASDLFLSAEEHACSVSVRHLGIVRRIGRLTPEHGRHCVAHLRAEAAMDVAEHRKPHDGRLAHRTLPGKVVDLRVCSLPTLYGEDVSVRILDRTTSLLNLDTLGLMPADHERLARLLSYPGGLILVTGPTGSGKTTTLYACLQHLNDGLRRIHTIEDPIEYALSDIHQSQPNARLGLHFPDLLRGIIRQGPDVIMIGEIRDAETAQTAVTAANSGHLVLATLHAPIAAGGVASMLAHGTAPHFLASSLIGIVSQRLVRTFCPECRFPVEGEFVDNADGNPDQPAAQKYAALGCSACFHTGFGARTALFEVLEVSRAIRELIQAREPAQAIEAQAYREGMAGFQRATQSLVARGMTDFAEVKRCIPPDCLRDQDAPAAT